MHFPKKRRPDGDCRYKTGKFLIRAYAAAPLTPPLAQGKIFIDYGVFASLGYAIASINDTFQPSLGARGLLPAADPINCDGSTPALTFEQNGSLPIHSTWVHLAANRNGNGNGILRFGANDGLANITVVAPEITVLMVYSSTPEDACSHVIRVHTICTVRGRSTSVEQQPRTKVIIDSISRYNLVSYDMALAISSVFQSVGKWVAQARQLI